MKTNIIRYINYLTNEVENITNNSTYEDMVQNFVDKGYEYKSGRMCSFSVKKHKLEFMVYYHSGSCCYSIADGVYYMGIFYNTSILDKLADILIMSEWECDYERDTFADNLIDYISKEIHHAKNYVNGRGLGEIGDSLRRHGYYIHYDGFSVCNFSKNGILFSATCFNSRWEVKDYYKAYLPNNKLTKEFKLADLNNRFERFFGDIRVLGKRTTEKEKIGNYKKFAVRTYGSRTLDTIAVFDNFNDADKFAKEESIKRAESTPNDLKRFSYSNPLDVSDKYDLLSGYLYYKCGSSEFLVFVVGRD